MDSTPYTLARWRIKPDRDEAFIAAWERLGDVFAALPDPPAWGSLLQSEADPRVFYSFGPWRTMEDIAAMREDADARTAIDAVRAECEEAEPGAYRLVRHVRTS